MANAYDRDMRELVKATAQQKDVNLHEGVYFACAGPELRDRRRDPRVRDAGRGHRRHVGRAGSGRRRAIAA